MMSHAIEAPQIHLIATPTVFPVGPANIFLYTGSPVTLFDAGTNTDEAWHALLGGLEALGRTVKEVEQVILTHHHLDHIGLVPRIKNACGAKILAHESVPGQLPFITDEQAMRIHLETLFFELGVPEEKADLVVKQRLQFGWLFDPFEVDEVFGDQAQLGPFKAHFRPGHSTTDTLFVHQEHAWAATGDHLIHNVTPNPLLRRCPEQGEREKSLVQYCDSLVATRSLDITACFAGHGMPFSDHRHAIDTTLKHIARRGERIRTALPDTGATPFEMTCALFPKMHDNMFYYGLSAITSHLELLETEGYVFSVKSGGVLHYHPGPSA